nr:MAG TPA: hypothetical protein [Caudoviricetes sp.]
MHSWWKDKAIGISSSLDYIAAGKTEKHDSGCP